MYSLQTRGYHPLDYYNANLEIQGAIGRLNAGYFSRGDKDLFRPLVDSLLSHDTFLLLADFASYLEAQQKVDAAYRDREHWTRMAILNVARMGKFSSDRAIREYCRDIWRIQPIPVSLEK